MAPEMRTQQWRISRALLPKAIRSITKRKGQDILASLDIAALHRKSAAVNQTQPVGLGSPPYLVMGFIGPVIQSLNISF